MTKKRDYLLTTIFGFASGVLLLLSPAPADRMLNIQNYLITVGGIISAFVIAYLSSKIFNLRAERSTRKIEIDDLSNKLTMFRRLLYYVMKSRDFWNHYDDIAAFKKKYVGLDHTKLRSQNSSELASDFWLKETVLSQSTIDLYLSMEHISGSVEPPAGHMLPWQTDKAASFDYSLDTIAGYFEPCNQIWYYLEGRYAKHGRGNFNDTGIWPMYVSDVRDLITRIDSNNKGKEFHREILAEIASEFYEYYLPRLYSLTSENIGVPAALTRTLNTLLFIMSFGVLFPIILQSLNVSNAINVTLTLLFVWLTSFGLVVFIVDFYNFLNEEVHLAKKLFSSSF